MKNDEIKEFIQLIGKVINNNPGAYEVMHKLQFFGYHWPKVIQWLVDNNYTGSRLWELYKDTYKEDITKLAQFIRDQINYSPDGI